MKKLAIMTSGGDAPGLNACIRSLIRTATWYGIEVAGIRYGFEGMISGDFIELNSGSVGNIIQKGGTILKSSRSKRFRTSQGRKSAYLQLKEKGIDIVIVIGGDGSLRGASILSEEYADLSIVGIPKTIDNDVTGTDYSIGFDTAVNTAMEAVDKIRDTAESHDRVFVVEVMGRDAGYLAFDIGMACGAEGILIPETTADFSYLERSFVRGWDRKKTSLIVIVAEGDESGGAFQVSERIKKLCPEKDVRLSILGHIQRGGSPTASDRILATRLGHAAIETVMEGGRNTMVGIVNKKIAYTPLTSVEKRSMDIDSKSLQLLEILTT